jgi:hypothetical protein
MLTVQVHQDQLEYVGIFATPAFPLLSRPERVVSGLYSAFLGMHSGLADFTIESESQVPLSNTIVVNLTNRGTYRFHSERIEWTFPDAGSWELDASILDQASGWLRSALPTARFASHYYTYYAHTWVEGSSAREFLLGFPTPQIHGLGENLGTGLIFHTNFPDHNWSIQLTIDHSNVVLDGLYLQVVATVGAEELNHQQTVRYIDGIFRESLKRLGLQFERAIG